MFVAAYQLKLVNFMLSFSRDDFDLGGEFKKLSSFQMDISDLDFSVPLKKTAKANAKQSLGKQELKNDKFSFTFDFNEYVSTCCISSKIYFVGILLIMIQF